MPQWNLWWPFIVAAWMLAPLMLPSLRLRAQSAPATAPSSLASTPIRTMAADSSWQRVWVVGTDTTKETFIEPRQLVVSGDLVLVLDAGTREIRSFDARTGAQRFIQPARGIGPGEYKRPALLAATPTGYAVLDQATSRLSAFGLDRRLQWDAVVPDVFQLQGLCIDAKQSAWLSYRRRDSSIVVVDSAGVRRAVYRIPWRIARPTTVDFAHEAFTSATSRDGRCAIAPLFGSEWATVNTATGRLQTYAYREAGAEPVMKTTQRILDRSLSEVVVQNTNTTDAPPISHGVMQRGDTVIVYAWMTSKQPRRTLDYFHGRTGRYLHSRVLPTHFDALTIGPDGTFYGTRIGEPSVLIAIRPTDYHRRPRTDADKKEK